MLSRVSADILFPLHRLRETPEFGDATCVAIACPACMTLGLAQSCSSYVTTVINGTDMVPTMSLGARTTGSVHSH